MITFFERDVDGKAEVLGWQKRRKKDEAGHMFGCVPVK